MSHSRQITRANNWKHAIRKRKIAREVLDINYYDNLHQYSKNKIHCSCPLCRSDPSPRFSEQRKIEQMDSQIKDSSDESFFNKEGKR